MKTLREMIDIVEGKVSSANVFHGTDADFKDFEDKFLGSANGTAPINMRGFNFTDSNDVAKTFGKNVIQANVTLNNPYVVDAKGKTYSDFKHKLNDILSKIDTSKYDGIIIKNYADAGLHGSDPIISDHYIPFNSSSIKRINPAESLEEATHDAVEQINKLFKDKK